MAKLKMEKQPLHSVAAVDSSAPPIAVGKNEWDGAFLRLGYVRNDDLYDPVTATRADYDAAYYRLVEALMGRPTDLTKWFCKGQFETKDQYDERLQNTPWNPMLPHVVQAYVGAIFKREPQVNGGDGIKDSHGSYDWRRKAIKSELQYSLTAMLEYEPGAKDVGLTQADLQGNRGKAVAAVYTEPDILDLTEDDNGELVFLKVRETFDPRLQFDDMIPTGVCFHKIYVYGIVEGAGVTCKSYIVSNDGAAYGPKEEPVNRRGGKLPLYLARTDPIAKRIVDTDLARLRVQCDLHHNLRICGHLAYTLLTPDPEGRAKKKISFTPDGVTVLAAGMGGVADEVLKAVEHNPAVIPELETRHSNLREEILSSVGMAPVAKEKSVSGASMAWNIKTGQEMYISEIVGVQEKGENILLIRRDSPMAGPAITVKYSRDFALDNSTIVTDLVAAVTAVAPISATAAGIIVTDRIESILPDTATDQDRDAIETEIADWVKRVQDAALPPVPMPLGADGGVSTSARSNNAPDGSLQTASGEKPNTPTVDTKSGNWDRSGKKAAVV